jgi:hypothetical protein
MAEPLFPHSGKDLRITYHICLVSMCAGNVEGNPICFAGTDKKTFAYKAPPCHQGAPT